jgi:hypothetical protein
VVEAEVGDVGALMERLRPDREERSAFFQPASPVTLLGEAPSVDSSLEVRIQVRLDTDIWFPRVMGLIEDLPEDEDKPDWYDNAALAERHTPRLNAFLADLRASVQRLGGRWEPLQAEDLAKNYAEQWDAAGVALIQG